MAYRRCITARTKQLYQQQRFFPSFSHTNHDDELTTNNTNNLQSPNYSTPNRAFRSFTGSNIQIQGMNYGVFGSVFGRNMSTSVGNGVGGKAELSAADMDGFVDGGVVEAVTRVAPGLSEVDMNAFVEGTLEGVAQVGPAVSEVAVAASDSFFPIAALQFVINHVHVATGLNWWASIALTTVGIRCLMIPFTISQLKASAKLSILKPKLDEIQQEMQAKGMNQEAASEGRAKMSALFKENKVTPFTPLKGILVSAPVFISFFLAIQNMAEKVPSFQQGGAYWFLDLTTPDPMYIFPVVTALTFWITVELNTLEGMEGNTSAKTMKNISRVFAALSVPLTASFAKAIFCYWITANVFSLSYGMVIKRPEVKKFLGIPIVPVTPPSPASQNNPTNFSFFDAIKKFQIAAKENAEKQAAQRQSPPAPSPTEASKSVMPQIPSSTILKHRIKSLEKEVKGRRKRGKKSC